MRQLSIYQLMDSSALAVNSTTNTYSVRTERCTGFAALMVTSSAGDIMIYQQVSPDNNTWYNPIDTNSVSLFKVATAIVKGDAKYITYDPVLANYTRFQVIEANSNATVLSLDFIFQEEI